MINQIYKERNITTSKYFIIDLKKSISISIIFILLTITIFTTSAFASNSPTRTKSNSVKIDTQATIQKQTPTSIGTAIRIER